MPRVALSLKSSMPAARRALARYDELRAESAGNAALGVWSGALAESLRTLVEAVEAQTVPWTPPLAEDIRADKTDGCDE